MHCETALSIAIAIVYLLREACQLYLTLPNRQADCDLNKPSSMVSVCLGQCAYGSLLCEVCWLVIPWF